MKLKRALLAAVAASAFTAVFAQDQPKALAAAVRAAFAAERVFAHSESLRQLDHALVLWDRVGDAG